MNTKLEDFWTIAERVQVTIVNCNLTADQCAALDADLQRLLPLLGDHPLAAHLDTFLTVNTVKDGLSPAEVEELDGIMVTLMQVALAQDPNFNDD